MGLLSYLKEIERTVDSISGKWDTLMAKAEDFKKLVDDLNVETTDIGNRIDVFIGKLKDGGMTSAEEDDALTQLGVLSDRLKALGTDPANPIPPAPPVPPVNP